ncbi:RNA polymerase ECF-type sigma factor [Pedobacter sp. BAL39]|uniref:RNA polymerase sigma factor n=1 Tax=Pedobacter sp. BAL39 TaxID=391596 RepID=UPI0001559A25|nr:RNA polymerase sigma-70 factor [Pedobacter sp. BAL39]EDM36259.1 RNA polymerase ECF-type sigma factor [Pedobacter sp. BAL39]
MTGKGEFSEQELLTEIAGGNQRAFKVIYDSYYRKIFSYALKYVKSETDAEEIIQEVFLKLWLRDPNSLPIGNLDGYFQVLVRNRSIDVLRRKVLENHVDLDVAVNWQEAHNHTEELIILKDTKKVLDEGIKLLTPQQRQVYKLCHQDGLKYEEAAKELNLSVSTVHSHMKLALKFLREYLKQHTDIAALLVIFKLLP